jgi:hypothetical protein
MPISGTRAAHTAQPPPQEPENMSHAAPASPASTTVVVFGPNLSREGEAKGYMHAHAAGCADCKHYGPGRKFGGERDDWQFEARSEQEIVEEINADFIDENEDSTWLDYRGDVYIAPCLKHLPFETPAAEEEAPAAEAKLADFLVGEVEHRSGANLVEWGERSDYRLGKVYSPGFGGLRLYWPKRGGASRAKVEEALWTLFGQAMFRTTFRSTGRWARLDAAALIAAAAPHHAAKRAEDEAKLDAMVADLVAEGRAELGLEARDAAIEQVAQEFDGVELDEPAAEEAPAGWLAFPEGAVEDVVDFWRASCSAALGYRAQPPLGWSAERAQRAAAVELKAAQAGIEAALVEGELGGWNADERDLIRAGALHAGRPVPAELDALAEALFSVRGLAGQGMTTDELAAWVLRALDDPAASIAQAQAEAAEQFGPQCASMHPRHDRVRCAREFGHPGDHSAPDRLDRPGARVGDRVRWAAEQFGTGPAVTTVETVAGFLGDLADAVEIVEGRRCHACGAPAEPHVVAASACPACREPNPYAPASA